MANSASSTFSLNDPDALPPYSDHKYLAAGQAAHNEWSNYSRRSGHRSWPRHAELDVELSIFHSAGTLDDPPVVAFVVPDHRNSNPPRISVVKSLLGCLKHSGTGNQSHSQLMDDVPSVKYMFGVGRGG